MSFVTAFLLAVIILSGAEASPVKDTSSIVCACRCCNHGSCSLLPDASWVVKSCDQCSTALCNEYIRSKEVRMETARLFEGIESDEPLPNAKGLPPECLVISVLEAATCTNRNCRGTTTIKAECYDRDAPLIKGSIVAFVSITIVAIIFGIIKNHIPAFQGLNERYFNY